ncbi:MAG: tryptophan synthase subunit alpha [Deltaproteobacteria bacterium]|nr:tryptophan synthase subunit alpha [Deltaproteobacteria bacterium]
MKDNGRGRIAKVFGRLMERGDKALITFITAGDPDIGATKRLVLLLERSGADIIELGIPFSDPMADGPTIQASSERAVKNGTTLSVVLNLVRDIRKKSGIPVVLFGYYNPIFSYGLKKFARDAKAAGVDGVLVVDLPPEEDGELKSELDREGVDLILLLTPTSDDRRMRLVASKANGFIYFVSVTGVTGARKNLPTHIPGYIKEIRKYTRLPVAVGFGISTPHQAKEAAAYADAVVVGSALVNVIARDGASRDRAGLLKDAAMFVSSLKKGMASI